MKTRIVLLVSLLVFLVTGLAIADDGQLFRRNISKTPAGETEEAGIQMMSFYVPAQTASGVDTVIEYYDAEGVLVETRDQAKPLVAIYIDGIEEQTVTSVGGGISALGGASFGERDAFAALSLDDGATWKNTNLSRSADLSSFILRNGTVYPGDVHYMTFAVSGNKVLAGWLSKYCESGAPAYSLVDDVTGEPLYEDLFGVAGAQGSVDYTLQGHPEVGEIPYSCVWTARGTLEQVTDDDGNLIYDIVWRKAERLTSGRRDANRLEIGEATEAGFMMVWQEDPEGLRPGQGLGPGEGWSGAIVNQKTDIWYSYIGWDDFDLVQDAEGNPIPLESYDGEEMPKIGVPMAVPVRLSDNNMCKADQKLDDEGNLINPYCYEDFDGNGTADFCAVSVPWTNPGGTTLNLCQTEDGRVLWGRNGASRPRLSLEPYTKTDGTTGAWVVMAYEELKGLGEGGEDDVEPIDIGKNIWYHTFDMFQPDLVSQGAQLNQPAVNPETGTFFDLRTDEWGNPFYETEIARRFNLMVQSAVDVDSLGTTAILIYKQGIINQGGPADIFLRRLVLPETFNPAVDNPYDFKNMDCNTWAYTDGSNPRYVEGLCLDPAINVSGTTIVACDNDTSGDDCAAAFPWEGGTENFPKVTKWAQTPDNLDEQSWKNPYDVAKGHRGFIDGDFIMMMYAWSPNWKANAVGNDHYNLYIRRSFDGGQTWTTTPASLGGNGTETCENYGHGGDVTQVCTTYGAGEFEQARNVSQLIGNKITILDPRYTPTEDTISDGVYPDDARDPSRFFIVYETGDNTTVAEGEAVPLDLFYSRAYEWGDEYDYVEYYKDKDGDGTDELVEEWDWLEHKAEDLSGEASVTANPAGTFFYAVWNQWQEDEHEVISNSDIWFRRVMYLPDETETTLASIVFASHTDVYYDDPEPTLTFVGSARAAGQHHPGEGITAYKWESNLDGVLCEQQICTLSAADLSLGIHTITFTAYEDQNTFATATTTLLVGETRPTGEGPLYLPLIIKN